MVDRRKHLDEHTDDPEIDIMKPSPSAIAQRRIDNIGKFTYEYTGEIYHEKLRGYSIEGLIDVYRAADKNYDLVWKLREKNHDQRYLLVMFRVQLMLIMKGYSGELARRVSTGETNVENLRKKTRGF